jgi:hypothetical protein
MPVITIRLSANDRSTYLHFLLLLLYGRNTEDKGGRRPDICRFRQLATERLIARRYTEMGERGVDWFERSYVDGVVRRAPCTTRISVIT